MHFQQDEPKDKQITALNFLPGKLGKFRSTERYHAPPEGSTIFQRSSPSHASLDSSWLVELKYAIFCRTGSTIKRLQLSKLFLSMVFKHGLLEGSTFLFQYSFITHKKLESSWLGKLKYALLARYYIRLKNESLRNGKKWHFTTGIHGHCSMGFLRDRPYYFDTATQAIHCWIALD